MRMKKWIALLLVFILLVQCTGCIGKSKSCYYGDEISRKTLRICIDINSSVDDYELGKILEELGEELKSACGIEKLAFEVLPHEGAERKTAQTRLRTEIMAGGGPDVFLMQTVAIPSVMGIEKKALLNFPEKNMYAGVFLPLDKYMENGTQFTDWNAQTKAVLDVGSTDEGQVIIPTTYTFPVLIYPESKVNIPYTTVLTMWEILDRPETAELGTLIYSGIEKVDERQSHIGWIDTRELSHWLGKLADYENDALLFTEEELYAALTTLLDCFDTVAENPDAYMENLYLKNEISYSSLIYEVFNAYFDTDMALVPVYSKDGGVTASVRSYAAVNRNTALPAESFAVIDYLMSEKSQQESVLYSQFFGDGIPLQNDLGSEKKPLEAKTDLQRYLTEPIFEDLLAIKDQITAVNFQSELDAALEELVLGCSYDETLSDERTRKSYVSQMYEKMERMMAE